MENQTKVKKTPVKYIMQEFIEQNKDKYKDYHEGFTAYEATSNPKASKGLFTAMWQVVYGKSKQERSKGIKGEKDELYYSTLAEFQKEQETLRTEASKLRIKGLLSNDNEEKKKLKQEEERVLDAMLIVNRKIRNYLESMNSFHKAVIKPESNE